MHTTTHIPGRTASITLHKPRVTQDGVIWPEPRRAMTDAKLTMHRMAYDLSRMVAARGADAVITTDDYLRLGWTREQIAAHAVEAAGMLPEIIAAGPLSARQPEAAA